MDNTYIPVNSNDTLLHLSLPKSPETLCGKIVADRERHPSASDVALKCDLCDTLSGGNSFIKTTEEEEEGRMHLASVHNIDLNLVPQEILDDDEALGLFHKQAHFHEAAGPGSRDEIATERSIDLSKTCQNCNRKLVGSSSCPECGEEAVGEDSRSTSPSREDRDDRHNNRELGQRASSIEKTTSNYTRNGIKIEDGFNLVLTTREASEIPYLDTNRVTISEKIHCPDCEEDTWLARVASCTDCGELKCDNCMDDSSFNFMLGTCKKCANVSEEEENYYLNSYEDVDYSSIQRASSFFADDEEYDDEASLFLSPPITD